MPDAPIPQPTFIYRGYRVTVAQGDDCYFDVCYRPHRWRGRAVSSKGFCSLTAAAEYARQLIDAAYAEQAQSLADDLVSAGLIGAEMRL